MDEVTVDEFWECPRCGSQIGTGGPARFSKPPACVAGHPRTEMEQVTAERFGHSFDEPDDS